jgi:hypothetical protein
MLIGYTERKKNQWRNIMYNIMLFLHVVGATLMGIYLVLPFLWSRVAGLTGPSQQSFVGVLRAFNRIGQYALIAAFITGGAMLHQAGVSVAWMITAIVLFLALAAISGIMGGRMKKLLAAAQAGSSTAQDAAKVGTFSWIAAVILVVTLYFMVNRF